MLHESFDLGGQSIDQIPHGRLTLFKGRMDVLIGRSSKVHRLDHNLTGLCCATIAGPEKSRAQELKARRGDASRHLSGPAWQTHYTPNDGDEAGRVSRDHLITGHDQWRNIRAPDAAHSCARTHHGIDEDTGGDLCQTRS